MSKNIQKACPICEKLCWANAQGKLGMEYLFWFFYCDICDYKWLFNSYNNSIQNW